jgi:hypothetical protein
MWAAEWIENSPPLDAENLYPEGETPFGPGFQRQQVPAIGLLPL